MNPADMIEVLCTDDPSRIALAKLLLAQERISCVATGVPREETFPTTFWVAPQFAERARRLLQDS
ncbi:MAG: hypothetical protein HY553_16570 [Elusimicrobia bacterium]|nr:hypothetical protein [Elusimicrobiota bacterium]